MGVTKTAETAFTIGRSVLLGGNVAALSLITRPRELVRYVGENLLLFRSLTSRRGVPQRNVYEVLRTTSSIEAITLGNLCEEGAWLSPAPSYATDIVSLCLICRILKPKTVFEIGTLTGYTALHFALNTEPGASIYTLDLPKHSSVKPKLRTDIADDIGINRHAAAAAYCFENTSVAKKINVLVGDSATFDFSPFYQNVDLFFIDGAHSYDYVQSDTLNAWKCCRPGSVIAWHDFGRPSVDGVARWVCEFARHHNVYSVPGGSLAFTIVEEADNAFRNASRRTKLSA